MKYYSNEVVLNKIAIIAKVGYNIINCIYCYVIIAIQKNNLYTKYIK